MLCMVDCLHRWWFDIDRHEAETLLMLPGNPRGTFLVRPSRGHFAQLYCVTYGVLSVGGTVDRT